MTEHKKRPEPALEVSVAQEKRNGPSLISIGVRGGSLGGGWSEFTPWARCGKFTPEKKARAEEIARRYNNAPKFAARIERLEAALREAATDLESASDEAESPPDHARSPHGHWRECAASARKALE